MHGTGPQSPAPPEATHVLQSHPVPPEHQITATVSSHGHHCFILPCFEPTQDLASFFSSLFWMATELQNAAPSLQEVKLSSSLAVNSLRANRIVMVIVTVAMLMLLIVTACVYPALSVHNILSFTSTVIPWNSHHLGP